MAPAFDFSTGGQTTSAQQIPLDQRMWYYGGQAQGPAPKTNPIRQWTGDFVESMGNAVGLPEGYLSERIAGGPTRNTRVGASDYVTPPEGDGGTPPPTDIDRGGGNRGGGNQGGGPDWSGGLTGEQLRALGMNPDAMVSSGGKYYNPGGGAEQGALGGGEDWESIYSPAYQALKEYQDFLRGAQTGQLENLGSDYGMYSGQITDEQKNLDASLAEQARQLSESGRSAAGEALRSYNALAQQNMSRYGLGTGAGSFISDLLGQEYLRSQGKTNEQIQSGTNELAIEGTKVKQYVSGKIGDLNKWKRDAESKINDNFMAQMADIESQKGILDREKADRKRAAVQDAVNYKRQIADSDRTFKTNLAQFAIESLQNVKGQTLTVQEIQDVVNSFMNEGTLSTTGGNQAYSGQYDITGKKKIDPNTGLPIA